MILPPWFWLAALLIIGGAGFTGYQKGYRNAENAARAAHATALESAIDQASKQAQIDVKAAVDAAEKRQKAKIVFKDKIVTVERLINAKPFPAECRLDDAAVGLFNDAIRNANNPTATTKPPTVPAPAAPSEREHKRVSNQILSDG